MRDAGPWRRVARLHRPLVTLFVVPVVYTRLDDFTNRLRRGRASHAPRVVHTGPAVRDPEPVAAD